MNAVDKLQAAIDEAMALGLCDECQSPSVARGLCARHYGARNAAGTLPARPSMQQRAALRFWGTGVAGSADECWRWPRSLDIGGYGQFSIAGKAMKAHVYAWEFFNGRKPSGLVLDHLCRNRACVNPNHLEPVTQRENVLRGSSAIAAQAVQTHCKRGHEFTPENTYVRPGTRERTCVACRRARDKRRRAR